MHTFKGMFYVHPYIPLTRQGNTSTIEAMFVYCRYGRVVFGAGHKTTRLVLKYIVSSKIYF